VIEAVKHVALDDDTSAWKTARKWFAGLKLVRRQMYGRGKIDLLQARLIGAE
jgi:hypothetical protein